MGPLHPSLVPPPALLVNPLSTTSSHFLSFLFTSGYVGSIYLSNHFQSRASAAVALKRKTAETKVDAASHVPLQPISSTEPSSVNPTTIQTDPNQPQPGERDHPDTIRRRMKAVGIATLLSVGGVWWVVHSTGGYTGLSSIRPTLTLLGLNLPSAISLPTCSSLPRLILPYILAPTLLLGPLYATYLDGDLPSLTYTTRSGLTFRWDRFGPSGWGRVEWRNYVVGPLTEEIVFRSCLLSVSLLSRTPFKTLVFATPLWFGIAHAHHAWETYNKGGRTSTAAIRAIAGSLFQLTYTTLFGWFATYNYLRTGSVIPALTSHAYCNFMGIYLPHIATARHPTKKGLIWGLYGIGIAGFIWGLRQL